MADHPKGLDAASAGYQAVLVVCSTQGDGVPPSDARDFCDWLSSPGAPPLAGLPFSVCALGDKSYTHFCRCGKQLDARLEALGGCRASARADVDREDWSAINEWMAAAIAALGAAKLQPQAPRIAAAAAGGAGAAHSKSRPFTARLVAREGLCVLSGPDDKDTVRLEFDIEGSGLDYLPGDALGVWPQNEPAEARHRIPAG